MGAKADSCAGWTSAASATVLYGWLAAAFADLALADVKEPGLRDWGARKRADAKAEEAQKLKELPAEMVAQIEAEVSDRAMAIAGYPRHGGRPRAVVRSGAADLSPQ